MCNKYPNKKKRRGFWKRYERANIKDYRKVWDFCIEFIDKDEIPFVFSNIGRKPNLNKKEYVCMSILHAYFDLDFRETEQLVKILSGKQLDHTNCVRWFGRLNAEYINNLVFEIHKKIIGIDNAGDYIADSTQLTCDRLEEQTIADEDEYHHITLKFHILAQYIFTLGLVSIVSVFATNKEANDSPPLRNNLLHEEKICRDKRVHADKGYFGKENIKRCRKLKLKPNIVPKERDYSDAYLKRYIRNDYDAESRKANRGLIEGIFGGLETETGMKVRCRKPEHRNIFLSLLALKHNLRAYFRATALRISIYFAPTPILSLSFSI